MVELLVVVTIMGILSAMGVASLRSAVINNRVKDAAINVTAYLERVASETNRLSQKVCVRVSTSKKTIYAFKGECTDKNEGDRISEYSLEGSLEFLTTCKEGTGDWNASGATFEPRFGLSAAPVEGCVYVQYGKSEKWAKALKKKSKNNIIPQISYDSGKNWTDL